MLCLHIKVEKFLSMKDSCSASFHHNYYEMKTCHYLLFQPVNLFPSNKLGFHDVFGNVWQWQEDHFNGLTTHTHWLYDDFSGPCYDGRHNMILVRYIYSRTSMVRTSLAPYKYIRDRGSSS